MRSLQSSVPPRAALIALNAVSGLAPRTMFRLSQQPDFFGRLSCLPPSEVAASLDISEKAVINLLSFPAAEFEQKEEARAVALDVRIITIMDEDYPARLKEISDPPVVLYVKGCLPASDDAVIAIVGARHATAYGLGVAEQFAMRLAEAGVAVISGMASGIDSAAHRGALKGGGRTFGVLGCGLDKIYPLQNRELYAKAVGRGGLISEFPLGAEPFPYNFPRRNRIVSGLSNGVVVVEANIKSGALITAEFALEQGRNVFAVPGRIDSPRSRGPHELIRNGARMILSVEDIFEEIPGMKVQPELFFPEKNRKPEDLTPDEMKALSVIEEGTVSFDTLAARAGLPLPALMGVCLSLQLRRLIRERPGKIYEIF